MLTSFFLHRAKKLSIPEHRRQAFPWNNRSLGHCCDARQLPELAHSGEPKAQIFQPAAAEDCAVYDIFAEMRPASENLQAATHATGGTENDDHLLTSIWRICDAVSQLRFPCLNRAQRVCGSRYEFGSVSFQPSFLTWPIMDCCGVDKVGTHSKSYFIAMRGCRLHVMWVKELLLVKVV